MTTRTVIAIAAAALAAAFAARAADGDPATGGSTGALLGEHSAMAAAAASSGHGASAQYGGQLFFERADRDGDGFVSRPEAASSSELGRRFNELDTEGEGKLSPMDLGASFSPSP